MVESGTARRDWGLAQSLLAIYALVGGVASFVGWYADIPRLTDWINSGISIQPNATIAVTSAALALLLLRVGYRHLAGALGIFVSAIGLSVMIEYATGIDFGIDGLLLFDRPWGGLAVLVPGRMGPPGAISWTVLGLALFFAGFSRTRRWPRVLAPPLALVAMTIATLALNGYLYGVTALYTVPTVTAIALQTATFVLVVSIGVVMAVPEHAPMRVLADAGPTGAMMRRILPAVIVIPIALGLLRLSGERAGYFDLAFGTAARTIAEIALMTALLWWATDTIGRQAQARKQAEDQLVESLREADRRKNEFLATLAHELRNPLAPMRNAVTAIKLKSQNDPSLVKSSEVIERQVSLMARLLDDLLDVGRITSDKLELRKEFIDLGVVVRDVLDMCRPIIEEHQHEVTFVAPPEPILVDADPARLGQVFGNLVHNACKYTEPRGHIAVSIERHENDALVSVTDSGIGIPSDKRDSIFDMFSQVDRALNRPHAGLGIGLHLVRRLVEMHGGRIDVHSDGPGHGSRFTVCLPALPVSTTIASPQATPALSIAQPTHRRRILVVDDNVDHAESLFHLLEMEGHEVHLAHDGREALAAADRLRPNVALLDLGLPIVDGFDACRHIREQPWGRHILLIAITGWGQDVDRLKSSAAGFDHHLVKPVDIRTITKILTDPPQHVPQ